MTLPIETSNPLFGKYIYPTANTIRERQQDVGWTAQEIPVADDRQDYKNNLSNDQLNLVTITLQLFVEIEQKVGNVWGQIASWFPHSEIDGACVEIERMEKAVHAFFYQKMSDELHIDPEDIARNQATIKVLKEKLEFLSSITRNLNADKALSLATVAMIEQVLLFSNFAMLKSFQANGNNFIKNTVTGVDFVVRDEQLHGEFAAYLFRVLLSEDAAQKQPSIDKQKLTDNINKLIAEVVAHEDSVIDYTFTADTPINGVTGSQLKSFIRARSNSVCQLLALDDFPYDVTDTSIADWFYRGSKSIKNHDFFDGVTNQYSRTWKEESFSRQPFIESNHD